MVCLTKMKKFWKNVEVIEISDNHFEIHLDNKILKTPMKKDLFFANIYIAKEISKEWDVDEKIIKPDNMIFYGLLSTAIDRIKLSRDSYIKDMIAFVDTDLTCYRSEKPFDLIELQRKSWDPVISYIQSYTGEKINTCQGIMPLSQNKILLSKLNIFIDKFSDQQISALHRMTYITGSIFISICALKGDILKSEAFTLSFLDEIWQAENWGIEEDAETKRDAISRELNKVISFAELLRN